jgi:iron complex transport system permease protein
MKSINLHDQYKIKSYQKISFLFCLFFLCIAFLSLDIMTGPSNLSFLTILNGLISPESLSTTDRIILWDIRLPDALIAIIIGCALGLAGIETQTGLNNPLASPFTLGISSAAVLGASCAIVFAGTFTNTIPFLPTSIIVPALSLLFALIASALIIFSTAIQSGSKNTIILFGVAIMFLCNALTSLLQYVASAEAVQQIVFWTIGNLTKAGWPEVIIVCIIFLIILPFSLRNIWIMTLLRSGENQVTSIGLNIERYRLLMILRVSVLTAFSVCFVGTIGFIGLVGPHIARLILGEDHRFLLPGACLCSAVILSFASLISKTLMPGILIPVGIITSFIGVPILVVLIFTRGQRL